MPNHWVVVNGVVGFSALPVREGCKPVFQPVRIQFTWRDGGGGIPRESEHRALPRAGGVRLASRATGAPEERCIPFSTCEIVPLTEWVERNRRRERECELHATITVDGGTVAVRRTFWECTLCERTSREEAEWREWEERRAAQQRREDARRAEEIRAVRAVLLLSETAGRCPLSHHNKLWGSPRTQWRLVQELSEGTVCRWSEPDRGSLLAEVIPTLRANVLAVRAARKAAWLARS